MTWVIYKYIRLKSHKIESKEAVGQLVNPAFDQLGTVTQIDVHNARDCGVMEAEENRDTGSPIVTANDCAGYRGTQAEKVTPASVQ